MTKPQSSNPDAARDDLGLEGRAILITGAARGLGAAYARLLSRHGACLVIHDAGLDPEGQEPDASLAEALAAELRTEGGKAVAIAEDLTEPAACRRAVARTIETYGRLDSLIHSAGLVAWRDSTAVDEALYNRISGVNADAAFWLCAAALPVMREQGYGRILLTTSGWALGPHEGSGDLALYCHGKGAQFGLAMALARNAGHAEIRTNLLAPVANTRMYSTRVPEGTLDPARVAGAAAWLVSPACDLTGCLVAANDGRLALQRLQETGAQDLGAGACDPLAAGAALQALAAQAV